MRNFLDFLLPSSAPMEWVPFSILVGLFLLGVIAYKLVVIRTPQNHFLFGPEIEESIHTPWAGYVLLLPSVLLVVGLLFTFLGLGVAIQQAGGALQASHQTGPSNQLTEQLRTVLGLIGLKFKASVWGILLHLLAQVMASKVHQKKRMILETFLTDRTRKLESLFEEKLFKQLVMLNEHSKLTNTTLGSLDKLAIASNGSQQSSISLLDAIRRTEIESSGVLKNIALNTAVLGQATADLRKGSESIEQSANALQKATAQASSALLSASGNLADRVGSIETNLMKAVTEFSDSTTTAISGLQTAVAGIPGSLTTGLNNFSTATSKTLTDFKGELKETLGTISKTMADSSRAIEVGVDSNKSLLETALGKFNDSIIKGMEKSERALTEATKQLAEAQTEGMGKIDQALRSMDETAQQSRSMVQTIHKYSSDMAEAVTNINVTNDQLTSTLQDHTKAIRHLINDHATNTECHIKELEQKIKALTQSARHGHAR